MPLLAESCGEVRRSDLGRAAWARVWPFAIYMLCLALREPVLAWLGASVAAWWYAIQIGLVLASLLYFWSEYTELRVARRVWRRTDARELGWVLGLGLAVFGAWIHLDVAFLSVASPAPGLSPLPGHGLDGLWLLLRIGGAVLVVPLMEELFWRSFVMRSLDTRDFMGLPPHAVSWFAVVLSSLAFGLEHHLWFAGILAGLAYAWLYRRGNLWFAVAAHAVTNLALGLWVVGYRQWQFW